MLRLALPDSDSTRPLNIVFAEYIASNKEKLRCDTCIEYAYGNITTCIANGGRKENSFYPMPIIDAILEEYKSYGIDYRFTFSSTKITPSQFSDTVLNELLKRAAGAIMYSDALAEYVRSNYPAVQRIASVTKQAKFDDLMHLLSDDLYDVVVWTNTYNKRLLEIPVALRSKVETFPLDCCPGNCSSRMSCYNDASAFSLDAWQEDNKMFVMSDKPGIYKYNFIDGCTNATKKSAMLFSRTPYDAVHAKYSYFGAMGVDTILELSSVGFERIKIEGRFQKPHTLLLDYVELVVKPEYQLEAYFNILSTVYAYTNS